MSKNITLYIIKLSSGKYYVGISNNPWKRWLQHKAGTGADVCKYDKPVERIHEIDTGTNLEFIAKRIENYTTMLWAKYLGADKVIGGIYIDKDYRKASSYWIDSELDRIRLSINREGFRINGFIDIDMIPRPKKEEKET